MAFHLPTTISLFITLLFLFATPSHSALTCATPKLPANRTFANCTKLPTLGAILHFTFTAANRSLSVAFSATPPTSSGWVSWGLNLAGGGMVGSQALVAIPSNTSAAVSVRRYNLTAYKGIDEVKAFTFDSSDLSAESANGAITIFATVTIPATASNVSHVWQVGPVTGDKPAIHATDQENLHSKAALPVALGPATAAGPTAPAGPASGGNASAPAAGGKSGAGERFGVGFYFWLVLALMVGAVAL